MAETASTLKPGLGATERKDAWWLGPFLTVFGLGMGFGYLTWAAFLGDPAHGTWGAYLSPLYSPPVLEWFPSLKAIVPAFVSPALLILWAPGGFRATCYYYRKAYYRSAFMTPPACAVQGLPQADYKGERRLFIFQNLHRYFMYLAVAFIFILWYDALKPLWNPLADGTRLGLGNLVMMINATFLTNYTLGCHSFRHLVGGKMDCFSCGNAAKLRYGLWSKSTLLNEHHMLWAWCSLASVGTTDLYIRLVANGVFHDPRFF
jgi:hypothetical protein